MYQEAFGLTEPAFELTPNPRFLFLPPRHQEALSTIDYALRTRKGLTVLTGDAGTGKTTLIQAALARLDRRAAFPVLISNPALTRTEFVETLLVAFGFPAGPTPSKAVLLARLDSSLRRARDEDRKVALIVDEAHVAPTELLEEIRLLGNIETATDKLLSIFLVGQPELSDRLNEPQLRQLKQRVGLRCALEAFTAAETAAYIATRLEVAGRAEPGLFSQDAVALIHQRSRGIPRTINVICENALVAAFGLGQPAVTTQMVQEVCRDFDLDGRGSAPPPPAPARTVARVSPPEREPSALPVVNPPRQADPEEPEIFGSYSRRKRRSFFARMFSR